MGLVCTKWFELFLHPPFSQQGCQIIFWIFPTFWLQGWQQHCTYIVKCSHGQLFVLYCIQLNPSCFFLHVSRNQRPFLVSIEKVGKTNVDYESKYMEIRMRVDVYFNSAMRVLCQQSKDSKMNRDKGRPVLPNQSHWVSQHSSLDKYTIPGGWLCSDQMLTQYILNQIYIHILLNEEEEEQDGAYTPCLKGSYC